QSRSDPPSPPAPGPPSCLLSSSWQPNVTGDVIAASIADIKIARHGVYVTLLLQSQSRTLLWHATEIASCLIRYGGEASFIDISDVAENHIVMLPPLVVQPDSRPRMIVPMDVPFQQPLFPPHHQL